MDGIKPGDFVRMKSLKYLTRNRIIKIEHISDDGEYVRFKILPNGPVCGQWVTGDDSCLVVDSETVHINQIKMAPQLYEKIEK